MKFRNLVMIGGVALSLAACAEKQDFNAAHYWQITDKSDRIYAQGPNVQKKLDRDISRCVADLREYEKTATIRNTIPANADGRVLNEDEKKLANWDSPSHEGALRAEHSDYHDFEGCMLNKGWERTTHIPFDVADEAKANWYLANTNYGYDPRIPKPEKHPEEKKFSKLND